MLDSQSTVSRCRSNSVWRLARKKRLLSNGRSPVRDMGNHLDLAASNTASTRHPVIAQCFLYATSNCLRNSGCPCRRTIELVTRRRASAMSVGSNARRLSSRTASFEVGAMPSARTLPKCQVYGSRQGAAIPPLTTGANSDTASSRAASHLSIRCLLGQISIVYSLSPLLRALSFSGSKAKAS